MTSGMRCVHAILLAASVAAPIQAQEPPPPAETLKDAFPARKEFRENPTAMSVISFANALKVHPAIVAGKIRHERRNFRLLSQFVGTGAVRRHFGMRS